MTDTSMITFKQFLAEGKVKTWDHAAIDAEKAFELLNAYCKSGLASIANGSVLWRGDKNHGPYRAIDPSTGLRTSKDTDNLYQLLMDNSSALSEYPSRSKSLICSTSQGTAQSYNEIVYAVFPIDGTQIAVSSLSDFIHTRVDVFGSKFDINSDFSSLFAEAVKAPKQNKQYRSIEALNDAAKKAELAKLQNYFNYLPPEKFEKFMKFIERNKDNLFTAIANTFFTPSKLGLKLVTTGNKNDFKTECWFSAKAVMIREDVFESVIRQMQNRGMSVSSKYK